MDLAAPVSIQSDAEQDSHEPEAPPSAKARRGRKPKADAITTESADAAEAAMPVKPKSLAPEALAPEPPASEPELPAVEAKAPKPTPSPRKTRRNREPEASAPPPLDIADESPVETHAAAAQWHAETGTVTFDWPAIEQVAAAEGPNQPMAKLLLAARTEGATSRWPF